MIQPDRIVTPTCPYCGVGCNLRAAPQGRFHLQGDLALRQRGQPGQPVRQGTLWLRLHLPSQNRVTTPLIRKTAPKARRAHPGLRPVRVARGLLGRGAGYCGRPPGGDLPAGWLAGPGGLLLRQGHQRRQLPAAEDVPRPVPHQQHRPLHPPVPCRLGGGAAAGRRLVGHEQHRRRGDPERLSSSSPARTPPRTTRSSPCR